MHYYIMNILDDDKNKLSLWENDQGQIYLEVGTSENEDAPFYTGFITLTKEDAKALINELTRLIKQMDSAEPLQLNPPWQEKKAPEMGTGQLPFSKVNWNK